MVQSNQKTLSREQIENSLEDSINDSLWIDGLQHQVCIRPNALPEVIMFLDSLDINEESQHSTYIMKTYLLKLTIFHNNHILNQGYDNDCDEEMWNKMKDNISPDDGLRNLSVPVFSYINPTMGPRFILHIILSLGEFDT